MHLEIHVARFHCVKTTHTLLFRIGKISEMLQTIDVYSSLGLSHIEGIDTLHSRFQLIVSGMKKKPYDILDQRKSDFDADFEEFKRLTLDIQVSGVPVHWLICMTLLA